MEEKLSSSGDLDATQLREDLSSVKTHAEIVELINELKNLEERYGEFVIEDVEVSEESEELIEVEHSELEQPEQIGAKAEIKRPGLTKKLKKYKVFRIKVRNKSDIKPVKSATFKIRFDNSGNLVNTDFRKIEPKEPSKLKTKIVGKLPSLKRKGEKGKSESKEVQEKKSKVSKLKGGLGKISKLKNVIPSRGKKEKKSKK